jgi:hypothetical protein
MESTVKQMLATLRESLDRDIDENSISLIPPAGLLEALPERGEAVMMEVYRIHCGHVLRRLVGGMALEEAQSLAISYLGLPEEGVRQLCADLRRICEYANRILAKTITRGDALTQMMTWPNADSRMVIGLLDEVLAVYQRQGIASFTVPEEDEQGPDGEIVNDSFATSSPHVRLHFMRLLRYDPLFRGLLPVALTMLAIALASACGAAALYARDHWAWATLLVPVFFWTGRRSLALTFLPRIRRFMTQAFDSALLTVGLIERVEPLSLLCIAELGNGAGRTYYGIKRLSGVELPIHRLRVGEAFPCVSVFESGDHDDRWSDFTPRPIAWGTADQAKIKDLLVKAGNEELDILRSCIAGKKLPEGEALLVLEGGTLRVV